MLNLIDIRPCRKEIIWDYFPENEWNRFHNILDCASGDGRKGMQYYIGRGLNTNNYDVHAIDINRRGLKVLSKLGVQTHHQNLVHSMPSTFLLDIKFDLILCVETLEHLTQKCQDDLLNDFIRILKLDGHLVITFPVDAFSKPNATHIRQPKYKHLLKKLEPLFQCVEMRKYGDTTFMLFFTGKLHGTSK